MTGRVHAQLAREPSTSPCGRCLALVAVEVGDWHAVELEGPVQPICDACASRDDPQGFDQLMAWRRAARPQRCRCARPWSASGDGCGKCGRAR